MQFTNENRKRIKANTKAANSAAADRRLIRGDIRGIRDDIEKNKQRVANNTRRIGRNERRALENSDDILSLWRMEDNTDYHALRWGKTMDKTGYLKKQLSRGTGEYWVDKKNYYKGISESPKQQKIRKQKGMDPFGFDGNTPYGELF